MRDDRLMKDGDWMTKREALRENLPPRFTDEDLHARLEKVHMYDIVCVTALVAIDYSVLPTKILKGYNITIGVVCLL